MQLTATTNYFSKQLFIFNNKTITTAIAKDLGISMDILIYIATKNKLIVNSHIIIQTTKQYHNFIQDLEPYILAFKLRNPS